MNERISDKPSAKEIIRQYGPQTALFLEFGNKYQLFATVEGKGITLYKKLRAVQALAYIVDYALKHYPDAAHGVIESLLETGVKTGDNGLYTVFLEIYERDLKSPQHDHGTGYEIALCTNELTRIEHEKNTPPLLKRGPHQFFSPVWFEMVESLGSADDPLFPRPFDTELAQALGETKNTTTKDLFDTLNQ